MQYSVTFCSLTEVASDVISRTNVGEVCLDVSVKFGDSRSNCSWAIKLAHFVLDNADE